jgi:LysR family hydrogen peroxide-inducible transcriptional activator
MTIQQLEYIIAVDNYRHFAKAAEACFVTQPTLSMMIQKLEDELDVKIFDRSAYPVEPTEIGQRVLKQARISVRSFKQIKEIVDNEKNLLTGVFKLGIIPTISSYLVPELLRSMKNSDAEIDLIMQETPTGQLIENLLNGKLDGGLAATPLGHPMLIEYPIYYEKFYAYVSPQESYATEVEIDINHIDINHIWLLENIHCLRGQIEKLCRMKKDNFPKEHIKYEAGSIDTLINIVDYNGGMTIIPEMTAMSLPEEKQCNLRKLKGSSAVREISLIVSQEFIRQKMADVIVNIIRNSVPKSMQDEQLRQYTIGVSLIA